MLQSGAVTFSLPIQLSQTSEPRLRRIFNQPQNQLDTTKFSGGTQENVQHKHRHVKTQGLRKVNPVCAGDSGDAFISTISTFHIALFSEKCNKTHFVTK